MTNFNWNKFLKGEIAVNCETKDLASDFIKECGRHDINIDDKDVLINDGFEEHESEVCYSVDNGLRNVNILELYYGDKTYYENDCDILVVSWY